MSTACSSETTLIEVKAAFDGQRIVPGCVA